MFERAYQWGCTVTIRCPQPELVRSGALQPLPFQVFAGAAFFRSCGRVFRRRSELHRTGPPMDSLRATKAPYAVLSAKGSSLGCVRVSQSWLKKQTLLVSCIGNRRMSMKNWSRQYCSVPERRTKKAEVIAVPVLTAIRFCANLP